MPVFSKIPQKIREKKAIANGGFAVFGSLLEVGVVFRRLEKKKRLPAHGYTTVKGKKFYYCRVGLTEDESIYKI